ncbi:hypothetical protein FDECE_18276 [Fusarium decemcellulare]|nr:hypothetical protein FDECE_18276 [Fusarium decemcellulare]
MLPRCLWHLHDEFGIKLLADLFGAGAVYGAGDGDDVYAHRGHHQFLLPKEKRAGVDYVGFGERCREYCVPHKGFAWAVRIQAFIALLFAIIVLALLRPRLPPRKSGPILELHAFLEVPYSLFTIGMFFIFLALYFAFFYINSYATSVVGATSETAASLLVIINAITIPSRPLLGYLSDKWFNPLLTMAVVSMLLACMLFVWIPVRTLGAMYAWAVLYGFATGGTQGMFTGALASLTHDPAKMGTRFGMVCSVLAFATLAGPPTAGGIIESMAGSFVGAQAWAGAVTVAGSLFIAAALWSDPTPRC